MPVHRPYRVLLRRFRGVDGLGVWAGDPGPSGKHKSSIRVPS